MKKEDAIDLLDNLIGFVEDNHGSDYDEALKIAIKALEEKPLKKYTVYATSEAEVSIDSEDELEIFNEAYEELIANMDYKIVREVD